MPPASRLGSRVAHSARERLARVHERLDRSWDRAHHVETSIALWADQLDMSGEHTDFGDDPLVYIAAPTRAVRRMIEALDLPLEEFVFVDYGSGKGRVLFVASEYPFRRIEGVEFVSNLHAVAEANARRFRGDAQRCRDIVLNLVDAVAYEIPPEPCLFFLYHPFEPPVWRLVLRAIEASYEANPRPMVLAYLNPVHGHVLDEFPFLQRLRVRRPRLGVPLPHPTHLYVTSEAAALLARSPAA